MSRSSTDVLDGIRQTLPTGWAWPDSNDSIMARFFTPLAAMTSIFEGGAEQLLDEVDPRTADHLLADYERVLGPDPDGRDTGLLSQRRLVAWQRWTQPGGQSIAFFQALAAVFGQTITITEFRTSACGRARCGAERCAPSPAQFVWLVTLPAAEVLTARCGAARCGNAASGIIVPSPLVGPITRAAPAHTQPIFSYTG
jgi:uncharacterized protein YmfQ (DUF2313 family)